MKDRGSFVYFASRTVFLSIQKTFFLGDIRGLENIPRTGPCIIAANHSSMLDPPLVGCHIERQINFFARRTLWIGGIASWWLDTVGTIPVDRDGDSDVSALKRTLDALRRGGLLTLFPEGTRSDHGELRKAKPGIGLIAAKSRAMVVPCRVFHSHKVLPRGTSFPRLNVHVDVVYGKPLPPERYDPGREAGKERYQLVADRIMAEIGALQRPRPHAV